jgi:BAG domain
LTDLPNTPPTSKRSFTFKLASSILWSLSQTLNNLRQPPALAPQTFLSSLQSHIQPTIDTALAYLSSVLPLQSDPLATAEALATSFYAYIQSLPSQLQGSLSPQTAVTALLTVLLSILLFMSWGSRFPSWGGRFSPFGRASPGSTGEVSDADFSYITAEDLARSRAQNASNADTDVLVLKHGKISYPVHFPANSIDLGELKVGEIRAAAARKLGVPSKDAARIKILYRGRNLKDDGRAARDENLRSGAESELMCVVGEALPSRQGGASSESEGEEDDIEGGAATPQDGGKKKKPRKRKNNRKKKSNSGTATPTGSERSSTLNPDATYVGHTAPPPRPSPSPQPMQPLQAQSPMQKLEALSSTFHTKFVPECVRFMASPPSDIAKRDFEHKKLTETILAQIVLKADAIEPEGDPAVRQKRKDLVKEAQGMLNRLDEVVK